MLEKKKLIKKDHGNINTLDPQFDLSYKIDEVTHYLSLIVIVERRLCKKTRINNFQPAHRTRNHLVMILLFFVYHL